MHTINTTWDVEKYKNEYESEEHWEMRRTFLIVHKNKYPEERLVCLAQAFFNIEFLGCRYDKDLMDLVAKLSEGIADSFRKTRENRLRRTFVQASDAAEAKVKRIKTTNC